MDGALDGAHGVSFAASLMDSAGHGLSWVLDEIAYGVVLVSPSGKVLQLRVTSGDATLERCVREALAVMQMPGAKKLTEVVVTLEL